MIVYFDLETGGLAMTCPIIQIAAAAYDDNGKELAVFERKLQFDKIDCEAEALQMNHYSPEEWQDAVHPREAVLGFAEFCRWYKSVEMVSKRTGKPYKVARLGGYNAATFDNPRLKKLFNDNTEFLPAHPVVFDVFQLALWWLHRNPDNKPENAKLATLAKFFGVEHAKAHDALSDVRATAAIAQFILARMAA